jgi:hypothetical protein
MQCGLPALQVPLTRGVPAEEIQLARFRTNSGEGHLPDLAAKKWYATVSSLSRVPFWGQRTFQA